MAYRLLRTPDQMLSIDLLSSTVLGQLLRSYYQSQLGVNFAVPVV